MDPTSPLPAIAALLIAFGTATLFTRKFGSPPVQGRFASIDGLRGYLGFFVFLHHACIWYFYLQTGQWKVPPSNLYTHFGQSSVALFFMITGFLFLSKVMDGRTRPVDWGLLYVSRFLRLVPLYWFTLVLLLLVVACLSGGSLNEPATELAKHLVHWLAFTLFYAPDLNGVDKTALILAWVTWSLPYEWFFYFSLPVLALPFRVWPPIPYVVLGVASIVGLAFWGAQAHHLAAFLGGMAAAGLVRLGAFRRAAATRTASCLVLVCLGAAVAFFPSAYSAAPLLLLSVAFALIACGNSLFGILLRPASRALGETAYSIYLLHGITLFVLFTFVIGTARARALGPALHWLVVLGATPFLLFFCFLTFRFIEQPAMHSTKAVNAWIRAQLGMAAPASVR